MVLSLTTLGSKAQQTISTEALSANNSAQETRVQADYGKLPLTFEANRGQTSSEVKFLARGMGYTAYLTAGAIVLSLRHNQTAPVQEASTVPVMKQPAPNQFEPLNTTLQFNLVGATKNPIVIGEDQQPGRVNYFIGKDPAKWHTNVPTYAKVRYKNVYPGIDLVYYGNHRQLEYDFEIQPNANPRQIEFAIQGASQIEVDGNGDLVLTTGTGDALHFQSPLVFQVSNGQRVEVSGGYVVKDKTHIGFQLGGYDPSKPLVVDPVLVYSTYMGGAGYTQPNGIVVDSSGCVYVVGYTDSVDFPLTTFGSLAPNADHVFVAKLDASGSSLIYADYIGGNSQDYGMALALDSANEVYLTGFTESSNFPLVNPYQGQQPGPSTGFVSQISADGSTLLYSTYFGGGDFDTPMSIGIDGSGQIHIAGYTNSQNFPVANAYQASVLPNQGGVYGLYSFLSEFNANGSALVYSTYLAGNSNVVETCGNNPCWPSPYSQVNTLAVDPDGNSYVAGITNTYNFPVSQGPYLATNTAPQNSSVGFVSKLNSSGNLDYSTYFYGSSGTPVYIASIAVDGTGAAYIAGSVQSDGTFPITSTSICNPAVFGSACGYGFMTKFDPTGATLLYSTFLGPNNYATPEAIALDANGDAYVAAITQSGAYQLDNPIQAFAGSLDVLLVEIDPTASTQLFSTYMGGSTINVPTSMALDGSGNLFLVGVTDSTDFPVTSGAFQPQLAVPWDAFISKIGSSSAPSVAMSPPALQFSPLQVGSTSEPQSVLVRNMGSAALNIASISVNGNFAETDNCGSSVSAAGSCSISVTFTPSTIGALSGSIVLTDNASGPPHVINLSGTGLGSVVALTPATLTFPSTTVGTSSSAQAVNLMNQGNAALTISNFQVTGDYGQTNNCPTSLSAGSSCTLSVTFTPTAFGSRSGSFTVADNAPNSPQTVQLSGTGSDFSLTSSPTSTNVVPGSTATYTLTVAPLGGTFPNQVNLSCSGAPAQSTCSLSQSAVTPGSHSVTVNVAIATTGSSSARALPLFSVPGQRPPFHTAWIQLQFLGVLGLVVSVFRRRKKGALLIGLTFFVTALLFLSGCAGGTGIVSQGSSGTAPGTYTVTVTGTAGTLKHSAPLTLIVIAVGTV